MNTPSQAQVRRAIAEAQTIVVKVGSSSLTEPGGHLDPQRLNALVAAIARVRLMGGRVVLVSSGAIAAGFGTLGFDKRPTDVADQQACAAVGQGLLMAQYEAAFARYGLRVGQILITVSDCLSERIESLIDISMELNTINTRNGGRCLKSNRLPVNLNLLHHAHIRIPLSSVLFHFLQHPQQTFHYPPPARKLDLQPADTPTCTSLHKQLHP